MNSLSAAAGIDLSAFAGPAWVTLAYLALYYVFMTQGLAVKVRLFKEYAARGEKFDRYFTQDREMLAADRVQLNMLEHMPVFLALLWLHAFVVSSPEATILGAIYTAVRAAYPLALGKRMGRGIPARLYAVTFTGYGVLVVLLGRVAWVLITGR